MKYSQKSEAGLSHILLFVLIIVVAGLVVLVGYRVMNKSSEDQQASNATPSSVSEVGPITSKAELESAEAEVDSADIDSELNPAELDEDINDLL